MDTGTLNSLNTVNYHNKSKGFGLKFKRKDIGTLIRVNNNLITISDQEIINEVRDAINEP